MADTHLTEAKSAKVKIRNLNDIDRRTRAGAQAFRLIEQLSSDLGGHDRLSTQQTILIEDVALLTAIIKDMSADYLTGGEVDVCNLTTLINAQRRLLVDLGLERKTKNITPSLEDYLSGEVS